MGEHPAERGSKFLLHFPLIAGNCSLRTTCPNKPAHELLKR